MASKPVYEISDILRILPHRYPFLLVDRVEVLERDLAAKNRIGWKIRAIKNVTFNEPFFSGHFPHRPVMPGVLQVEAMAQAGCLVVVDPNGPEMDVAIAGINNAKFRRPILPGDQLELRAEVTKDRGQILMLRCEMYVGGELASEADLIAKVFPKGS
ncbi:MAG: 3-hydroxyacyl-ACP dehydratase FabZ [Bdellovibrionales bacterium]|jgi:beta-hydroxyacyl-ACP dehydratase FabZ|nr:3-hydroxyacyl-ACP dehydratase FabZ [Bdellovibrionales bacterium]